MYSVTENFSEFSNFKFIIILYKNLSYKKNTLAKLNVCLLAIINYLKRRLSSQLVSQNEFQTITFSMQILQSKISYLYSNIYLVKHQKKKTFHFFEFGSLLCFKETGNQLKVTRLYKENYV